MGKKQRIVFVALIVLVMAVALISAFSLSLFHKTPEVVLPSPSAPDASLSPSAPPQRDYLPLTVDTGTVQQVIASLKRPESYARNVTVELQGRSGFFGALTAKITVDGGWTQVTATLPDGRISHSLVGDGSRYIWYGTETDFRQYDASERDADLAQRLPTYEDVLAADPQHIIDAGYEDQGGLPCVYVAVEEPELGYVERYWVSVDTGLLVCATSEKDGAVFYRMSGYVVETPAAPGQSFNLPDGQTLHTIALPSGEGGAESVS